MRRLNFEVLILLDWISRLFVRVVILISSIIILYRIVYISREIFIDRFIYLVILFILSIILIIISPNIFRIILGWDGLGITSYCLVIYYQNFISYNSGILTVLRNRIGDVGLLISIRLIIMYGRWNMIIIKIDIIILMIMILAALTKRAQIPFRSWLPRAIAAPTPVSALVHSSTLVTAGIYLIIRFNKFLINVNMNIYLLFLSILTILMSGIIANFEYDLKKIIALSTLSQLGLIIIILRLGYSLLAFYHLLTHAIFKSLLFMCSGIIIHRINNNQDIRIFGNLNEFIPFTIIRFYISLLSLTGILFFTGFYSKDLIIELIYLEQINIFLYLIILLSLILTVSYSIRLFIYIFFYEIKFFRFIRLYENNLINISIIILIFFSIIFGRLINWIFFYSGIFPFINIEIKLRTLKLCGRGIFLGIYFKFKNLIKIYFISYYFRSIWFINYFWIWIFKPFMKFRNSVYFIDKRWIEFFWRILFINIILRFKNFIIRFKFKIFIFIFFFIVFLIFLYFS